MKTIHLTDGSHVTIHENDNLVETRKYGFACLEHRYKGVNGDDRVQYINVDQITKIEEK